jgi:hypothetical protein
MSLLDVANLCPPFASRRTPWPTSVNERCVLAVQARIRGLRLSDLNAASVVVQKVPWARDFLGANPKYALPGVIIAPWGEEQMNPSEGTNLKDDVGYPVLVSIIAADRQRLVADFGKYLSWRERIARAFRNQPLPGVDEVISCSIDPGPILQPEAFLRGVYHSSMTLRFISREPRAM